MAAIESLAVALLNGLADGMLLFLIAVGLTLIFGVLGVLNFAHGSFYMLGAYVTFFFMSSSVLEGVGGKFYLALLIVPLVVAMLGGLIERFLIRPIYEYDHIFQLLLTFAFVLIIDNGVRLIWGTDFRSVNVSGALGGSIDLFGRTYPQYNIILIVLGGLMAIAMWLVFERTRFGKTVRAASQDRDMANSLGVNVPFLFTAVFFIGTALAAFGGVLAAPYRTIQPTMGESIIVESFVVVVLGGLGSFACAFVGALLIGLMNSLAFIYLPQLEPVIPFVLMAVILLVRPAGLFGVDPS